MPPTDQELVAMVDVWIAGHPMPGDDWRWADGAIVVDHERRVMEAMREYVLASRKRHARGPQLRAMRLLRRLLTADQGRELTRLGYFHVTAPSGTAYRLDPRRGMAERVERHGRRWFAKRTFCLHDEPDAGKMPPADVTIAHLLLLLADEPAFLREANAWRRDDQLWNGEYLRRMRRRHRVESEAVVAT